MTNSVDTTLSKYSLTTKTTPDQLSSSLRLGVGVPVPTNQNTYQQTAATVAAISGILNSTPQQTANLAAAAGVSPTSLYNLGPSAGQLVGGLGLKLSGLATDVNRFSNQLSGLSSNLQSKSSIASTSTSIFPENVDTNNLGGLLISKLTLDQIKNIPATQPNGTVAPTTAFPDGNPATTSASTATSNPLSNIKQAESSVSLGAAVGALLTGAALIKSLTSNNTSIESNISQAQQITGSKVGGNLTSAAVVKYGSKGATASPLSQYVNK